MSEEMVHKVTLSSNKVVLLREFKIKHQRLAAQAAGVGSDNANVMGVVMAEEILKLLLVQIDGVTVQASKLEDLDSLFTYSEYSQLTRVIGDLMGGNEEAPKMEMVSGEL